MRMLKVNESTSIGQTLPTPWVEWLDLRVERNLVDRQIWALVGDEKSCQRVQSISVISFSLLHFMSLRWGECLEESREKPSVFGNCGRVFFLIPKVFELLSLRV